MATRSAGASELLPEEETEMSIDVAVQVDTGMYVSCIRHIA